MEKFGLLNLLKAIETLSPPSDSKQTGSEQPAAPPVPPKPNAEPKPERTADTEYNVMASVLERHERISNRLKNNTRKN